MSIFEINWNGGSFIIIVNAILTLQLSPHVGHFDVQMRLKNFFDISNGFRYKKKEKSSPSIYRDVHDYIDIS